MLTVRTWQVLPLLTIGVALPARLTRVSIEMDHRMNRSRFPLLVGMTFGGAVLCAAACSSDAAHSAPGAGAGQAGLGGANAAGSPGVSGGATSGGADHAGTGGVLNTAGAATGASGGTLAGTAGGSSGSAGAPGAGAGGGGSACHARPGLLACDDFESATPGAVPPSPWSAGINGDGTVAVDASAPAHSGSKSVHVHGTGFQTLLVYHDAAKLPQAAGRFYVRAFLRLAEAVTAGHNTFLVADTFAAPGAGNALRLGEQNSMLMMTVGGDAHGYLSNQNYYNDHLPGVVFKAAEYSCLELLLDAAHTEIQVWVEGVDVPDLHVTDLAHENYDALRFGFEKYAGPESDIWYDDIALGTERIGCD